MCWSAARIVWLVLVVVCVDARTARNASIRFFSNKTVVPRRSFYRHHNGKPYHVQIDSLSLNRRVVRKNVTRWYNATQHHHQHQLPQRQRQRRRNRTFNTPIPAGARTQRR